MIKKIINKEKGIQYYIDECDILLNKQYIVFIGKNGTGKTTQLNLLKNFAKRHKYNVIDINDELNKFYSFDEYKPNWNWPNYCKIYHFLFKKLLPHLNTELTGNGKKMWLKYHKHKQILSYTNLSDGEKRINDFIQHWFSTKTKLDILFWDEPENYLHPTIQLHLLDYFENSISWLDSKSNLFFTPKCACQKLVKTPNQYSYQFFLTTHSPYVIWSILNRNNSKVYFFNFDNSRYEISEISKNFVLEYPTIGEINYLVFDIPSIEYFNSLYEYLCCLLGKKYQKAIDEITQPVVEKELKQFNFGNKFKNIKLPYRYKLHNKQCQDESLITYVRNSIHHPNSNRINFNDFKNLSILKIAISQIIHIVNSFK